MLATDNWCIKVADKVYGPYTQEQLSNFAKEGRLTSQSLVAPAGGKLWREARLYPPIANILEGDVPKRPSFGKNAPDRTKIMAPGEGEMSNFLVIFDVVKGTAGKVEEVLHREGTCFRLTDNVWVVRSTNTALGLKNALIPHLSILEPVFVVDCGRGRTSWQNFVPETHSRLTKAWIAGV